MITAELLDEIINTKKIDTVFQPIVSLKENRVIGVEALSRGGVRENGTPVSPLELFSASRKYNKVKELDRLCREKAVQKYAGSELLNKSVLFINIEPVALESVTIGSGWLDNLVKTAGISPGNIAIEIVESAVKSKKKLLSFVSLCRRLGFLIVLDDFGADNSNMNRLSGVRPDIIKIDRNLIDGISGDYYKQAIVKSIISLASKTGALSLAEGVETIDDVIKSHELGADLFQGFFFGRPESDAGALKLQTSISLSETAGKVMNSQYCLYRNKKKQFKSLNDIFDCIANKINHYKARTFNRIIDSFLLESSSIQCVYILNRSGIQITDTACRGDSIINRPQSLFKPSLKGTSHSLKEYFYKVKYTGNRNYFSEPYISLATGRECITLSGYINDGSNCRYILCIDFDC